MRGGREAGARNGKKRRAAAKCAQNVAARRKFMRRERELYGNMCYIREVINFNALNARK